jgi:hypothetical protein
MGAVFIGRCHKLALMRRSSGPEKPQRGQNGQNAAAVLGSRGASEHRAEAVSVDPPDRTWPAPWTVRG